MTDDGFTTDEARMLPGLLDVVIPPSPDGRLPGAGSLDLLPDLLATIRRMPMVGSVVEYGLSVLAQRAAERDPGGWDALAPAGRAALLEDFAAGDQFFLPAFLFLAYAAYYRHPRVVTALGMEPRPPHPQGYPMEEDDWSLLEAVRRRGKIHREA